MSELQVPRECIPNKLTLVIVLNGKRFIKASTVEFKDRFGKQRKYHLGMIHSMSSFAFINSNGL